ncbi:uncharacterized protein LOC119328863 [Triticum dicoccoides]|uniref:uncharacterized protein LOC119328863 n=1 Tax=Triticum dicoccoides TaxID=85692 RepID=UPI00189108DA|nr:uncharacterized protein LOC119328863 [Triticum dicoccoides]
MDKVLAFSILSAKPADIGTGPGACGCLARPSLRGRKLQEDDQARAQHQRKQGCLMAETEQLPVKVKSQAPSPPQSRFTPEFDGIDSFETIVCD